jgi:hypothetical protein
MYVARHIKEGGNHLIHYLLMKAVQPSGELLPDHSNMVYHDISRLPKQEQAEWKEACREELEALYKRQVFTVMNLPKGQKAISNRRVFLIKSDGRKHA